MSDKERDELAMELFIVDNHKQPREQSVVDWEWFTETPKFGVRVENYKTTADGLIAAGWTKPRTISTVEELDALPRNSIVAVLTHSRNVPITVVFQRGSNSEGGGGWCTPEAMGQITSEQVFEYIGLNCLPYEFTVLHEPTA